jgi:hypothetical protein
MDNTLTIEYLVPRPAIIQPVPPPESCRPMDEQLDELYETVELRASGKWATARLQEHNSRRTRRHTLRTHYSTLWPLRLSPRYRRLVDRIFPVLRLAHRHGPPAVTDYKDAWDNREVFDTIFCRTSTLLPGHFILVAESGDDRWLLAHWGPTPLPNLESEPGLIWLDDLHLGSLIGAWSLAGILAGIAFFLTLCDTPTSTATQNEATVLLYLMMACGGLALCTQPVLEWFVRRYYRRRAPSQMSLLTHQANPQ